MDTQLSGVDFRPGEDQTVSDVVGAGQLPLSYSRRRRRSMTAAPYGCPHG
jgi:hypothetical protein